MEYKKVFIDKQNDDFIATIDNTTFITNDINEMLKWIDLYV